MHRHDPDRNSSVKEDQFGSSLKNSVQPNSASSGVGLRCSWLSFLQTNRKIDARDRARRVQGFWLAGFGQTSLWYDVQAKQAGPAGAVVAMVMKRSFVLALRQFKTIPVPRRRQSRPANGDRQTIEMADAPDRLCQGFAHDAHGVTGCMKHHGFIFHHGYMAFPENKIATLKRRVIFALTDQLTDLIFLHVAVARQTAPTHGMRQLNQDRSNRSRKPSARPRDKACRSSVRRWRADRRKFVSAYSHVRRQLPHLSPERDSLCRVFAIARLPRVLRQGTKCRSPAISYPAPDRGRFAGH